MILENPPKTVKLGEVLDNLAQKVRRSNGPFSFSASEIYERVCEGLIHIALLPN